MDNTILNILNIMGPSPEEVENYFYLIDMIIRVSRLTLAETEKIENQLYQRFLQNNTDTMAGLYAHFQLCCEESKVRPAQYWKYLFE